ncbi:nuclear transport factor 2 family protein [Terriglobus roseus]|uniref:Ketosteroid isomerase homolog n=1 Tax=Terriglobus roseus TaxID=392734 RepID=A0A1H4MNH5_9BACT|nr:nuclear transport factor 2 family protein [Terriglobus roseus]SEB84387.1 Ketosteroid isomerase homolog [Terriglobus roseus]
MRRIVSVGLLLAGSAGVYAPAQTTSADDATFQKLQNDWAEARKKQDVPFLERFYTAEFSVGNMNGQEATREQDIDMFRSKILKPAVITDTAMKVVRMGDAAMVTGAEHLEGIYAGHSGSYDLRFTNVYVHRDGRWQLLRHQATPIGKP